MSLASQIDRVQRKLEKYKAKIDEAREEGLFTRDTSKLEDYVVYIWRLQKKARSAMKRLPATERRDDVALSYADVHDTGEQSVKSLLDFRAELCRSNVSAGLRVGRAGLFSGDPEGEAPPARLRVEPPRGEPSSS